MADGMFGLSPEEIMQQRQMMMEQRANQFAKQEPFERANAGMYKAGAGLADIGAGMMGGYRPEVRRAEQMRDMQRGMDTTTPEGLMAAAKQFNDQGMTEQALKLVQAARDLSLKQAQAQKYSADAEKQTSIDRLKQEQRLVTEEWIKGRPDPSDQEAMKKWLLSAPPGVAEKIFPGVLPKMLGGGQNVIPVREKSRDSLLGKYDAMREAGIPLTKDSGSSTREIGEKPSEEEKAFQRKTGESEAKRANSMKDIGSVIQQAEDLLDGTIRTQNGDPIKNASPLPTGSGIGTVYDSAASIFGVSPKGSLQAQQLKAVAGALTSKMPRMEGPQSDKDTMLYREMAGVVGDSNVPVDRRKAALKTVKDLWAKYENKQEVMPDTGWSAQSPNEVKALFKSNRISKEEAKMMLKDMEKQGKF